MNLVRSALIGVVALLMFLGGFWMFQRETMIIRNQDALIATANQHEKTLSEVVQFLNQEIQKGQKMNEDMKNFNQQQPQKAA